MLSRTIIALTAFSMTLMSSVSDAHSLSVLSRFERQSLKTLIRADSEFCNPATSKISRPNDDAVVFDFFHEDKDVLPHLSRLRSNVKDDKEPSRPYISAPEKTDAVSIAANAAVSRQRSKEIIFQKVIRQILLKRMPPSRYRAIRIAEMEIMNRVTSDAKRVFDLSAEIIKLAERSEGADLVRIEELESERLIAAEVVNKAIVELNKSREPENRRLLADAEATAHPAPFTAQEVQESWKQFLKPITLVASGHSTCGLSLAEQLAIEQYTEGAYSEINAALWKKQVTVELQKVISVINNGLSKLRPFVGLVHRDVDLPKAALDEHSVGNVVTYLGYTSSSIRGGFSPTASVHIDIESRTGRFISPNAQLWSETEVLFMPSTRFKVVARYQNPDGSTQIKLEEME